MEADSIKRPRPTLVCAQCKLSKRKCDKLQPTCTRCFKSSLECIYEKNSDSRASIATDSSHESGLSPRANLNKDHSTSFKNLSISSPSSFFPEHILNTPLTLWDPNDMLIVSGSMTNLCYPLDAHSISQNDTFMRALCSSLHGMTLVDLNRHLGQYSLQDTSQHILTPLPFIEKVFIRMMDFANANRVQAPLMGVLYNSCWSEDDKLAATFQSIVPEIESLIMPKKDCDQLLKGFYQNIFPFYPFMDVWLIERELETVFTEDSGNIWRVNTSGRDARRKMEIISLFMIIMAMSLKQSALDPNLLSILRTGSSETAQQLSLFSHRLLCILDIFRYPNETTFTCLLYFYIAEHLNPDSTDVVIKNTTLLSLKQITDLSVTLGLNHDPSKFKRLKDPLLIRHRRMLWLGVQSLRFQLSLTEGDWDYANCGHMEAFAESMESSNGWNESPTDYMGQYYAQNLENSQDNYEFHMLLAKMISTCIPVHGNPCLSNMLDSLIRAEDFMSQMFPLHLISDSKDTRVSNFARDTLLDVGNVKRAEIFLANIVGRTCFLNIWDVLSIHFENKCIFNWEENEKPYHYFTLKSFDEYLNLANIICEYLNGRFGGKIPKEYGYVIDKQVCYAIVRIFFYQCRILLRLSFKDVKEMKSAMPEDETKVLLNKVKKSIRNQMAHVVDLVSDKLEVNYMCIFQIVPMLRYILYLTDAEKLVSVTNDFWDKATITGNIPKYIEQQITLKWGLDANHWKLIKRQLMSAHTLKSFNEVLLKQFENDIMSSPFGKKSNTVISQEVWAEYTNINDGDVLSQFLQNNADAFWDILFDNLSNESHS